MNVRRHFAIRVVLDNQIKVSALLWLDRSIRSNCGLLIIADLGFGDNTGRSWQSYSSESNTELLVTVQFKTELGRIVVQFLDRG
jgi:hypothetical protein